MALGKSGLSARPQSWAPAKNCREASIGNSRSAKETRGWGEGRGAVARPQYRGLRFCSRKFFKNLNVEIDVFFVF